MSCYPSPITESERKAKFAELVAIAEQRCPDRATALDLAVKLFGSWAKAETKLRMPKMEYRVLYRRHGWTQPQVRLYQRRSAALSFMETLRKPYKDCEPLSELRLEERRVESVWWPRIDEEFPR